MFDAIGAQTPLLTSGLAAAAVSLMVLDYLAARLSRAEGAPPSHDRAETAASLAIMIGNNLIKKTAAGLLAPPFFWVYQHRLFDIPVDGALSALALFLAVEFCYYWMHRAAHRVRWMWATHRVHHSTTKLNLTAAVRLGWTGLISGNPLFFLPVVWIGFHPLAVMGVLTFILLYQFPLHTHRRVDLGPLEAVLNTPARHQAHHAANASCLDKNFGGVLIVFDRLFGTLGAAPRDARLRYGLAGEPPTANPVRILFDEWGRIWRDLARARTARAAIAAAFGPPRSAAPTPAVPRPDPQSPGVFEGGPSRSASPK